MLWDFLCKPHGEHKAKTNSRYTKINEKDQSLPVQKTIKSQRMQKRKKWTKDYRKPLGQTINKIAEVSLHLLIIALSINKVLQIKDIKW